MAADDIYTLLLGGEPDARATAREMADQLRRRRGMAQLSAIGAPDPIAALGGVMQKQASEDEKNLYTGLEKRMQYGEERQARDAALRESGKQADLQRALLVETLKGQNALRNTMARNAPSGGMDSQTLDMLAHQYAKTGNLPPLGFGQAAVGTRQAIFKRAAQIYPDLDVASNIAGFKADTSSLQGVQKMSDAVEAFERTAGKNLDLLLTTAKDIVDTGSPILNKPLRYINERALGSKEQAAYNAARQVALTEISRVVSNPNLVGQLSDSARHEVFAFNPADATLAQTVAVAKILKQDMSNRIASLREQRGQIQTRLSAKPASGGSGKRIKVDAEGNVIP